MFALNKGCSELQLYCTHPRTHARAHTHTDWRNQEMVPEDRLRTLCEKLWKKWAKTEMAKVFLKIGQSPRSIDVSLHLYLFLQNFGVFEEQLCTVSRRNNHFVRLESPCQAVRGKGKVIESATRHLPVTMTCGRLYSAGTACVLIVELVHGKQCKHVISWRRLAL